MNITMKVECKDESTYVVYSSCKIFTAEQELHFLNQDKENIILPIDDVRVIEIIQY